MENKVNNSAKLIAIAKELEKRADAIVLKEKEQKELDILLKERERRVGYREEMVSKRERIIYGKSNA